MSFVRHGFLVVLPISSISAFIALYLICACCLSNLSTLDTQPYFDDSFSISRVVTLNFFCNFFEGSFVTHILIYEIVLIMLIRFLICLYQSLLKLIKSVTPNILPNFYNIIFVLNIQTIYSNEVLFIIIFHTLIMSIIITWSFNTASFTNATNHRLNKFVFYNKCNFTYLTMIFLAWFFVAISCSQYVLILYLFCLKITHF